MNQETKINQQFNDVLGAMIAPLEKTAKDMEQLIESILPELPIEAQEELQKQIKDKDLSGNLKKKLNEAIESHNIGGMFAAALQKIKDKAKESKFDEKMSEINDAIQGMKNKAKDAPQS